MTTEVRVKPNVKQAVPFLWVSNLEESLRFYVEGLGFALTRRWMHEGKLRWCWLEIGDAALMLQEFWREGQHANLPQTKVGVGVSVCFQCQDALAIYSGVKARGVAAKRPFVGNGMWVTGMNDPDGYHLSFESPTDVAEETEYAEERG